MADSEPLVLFGIALIIVVGCFIVIPFWRGKSEILTAWNALLLGLIIFTGLGSIEVKYVSTLDWQQVEWFHPNAKEMQSYMRLTAAFVATLLAAYYLNGPAKRFAQGRLQKWPEITLPVTIFVLCCCLSIILLSLAATQFTFFGPALFKLGHKSAVFACVFSFGLWYTNRLNVTWLLLFLGVLLTAIIYSMLVSPGRRLLLSIFFGPLLYVYWAQVRHWKPTRVIVAMAIAGMVMLAISAVYANFRWYNLAGRERRTVKGVVQQIKNLQSRGDFFSIVLKNRLQYCAQDNAHFAMLTQRYISQGALTPVPLNTLRFLASYPIPRKVWSNKPEVIGLTITRDTARILGTNWGIGIAGHGAYEGGVLALMLYAVLLAFFVRLFDEPLRLQPGNPFLIAIHAGALPHIIAIPRGDFGVMVAEASECVVLAVILGLVCRAIFGTQRRPLPTAGSWSQRQSGHPPYRLARTPHADR